MEEYKKIKDACIKRWSTSQSDDKLQYFSIHFEDWITGMHKKIVPTVLSMIEHFEYYNHEMVNTHLRNLHLHLLKNYGLNTTDALYTYIKKKNGNINSSIDYWTEYRLINSIPKECCSDDIRGIDSELWALIDKIVIIDDCCGTGGSLEKFFDYTRMDYSGKTVFFIVIHALELSSIMLGQIMHDYNVKIILLYANCRGKVFCSEPPNGISAEKEAFINESQKLGIPPEYSLGYKESEALMAFYNNTPNNTFGIFWYNNEEHSTIFPRELPRKAPWANKLEQMKRESRARRSQNYYAKKLGSQYE